MPTVTTHSIATLSHTCYRSYSTEAVRTECRAIRREMQSRATVRTRAAPPQGLQRADSRYVLVCRLLQEAEAQRVRAAKLIKALRVEVGALKEDNARHTVEIADLKAKVADPTLENQVRHKTLASPPLAQHKVWSSVTVLCVRVCVWMWITDASTG